MCDTSWLPEILPWVGTSDGQPASEYLDRIYGAYQCDFHSSNPTFRGLEVHPKRLPEVEGRCGTFWHVISQTMKDGRRIIRKRRCERIPWIRPLIEAAGTERVRVYRVDHSGEFRWEIALADFSYIVVLAERAGFFLLWTAFEQEEEHRRRKARDKYERWCAEQKS